MVSQPDTRARAFLQLSEQIRDVELSTDVKVGFVERKIKLKHRASRPGLEIYVMRHAQGLYPIRARSELGVQPVPRQAAPWCGRDNRQSEASLLRRRDSDAAIESK